MDVPTLADLLHETAEHHDPYEKSHRPHTWWDWYARYLNARLRGSTSEQAAAARRPRRAPKRRQQLRDTLPMRRVVGLSDVAALAVHLMTNAALTGATCDIDGGQQLIPR